MDVKFVNEIRVWSSSTDESQSAYFVTRPHAFVPCRMTVNALDRNASELAQRSLADAILMMVFSGRDTDFALHMFFLLKLLAVVVSNRPSIFL